MIVTRVPLRCDGGCGGNHDVGIAQQRRPISEHRLAERPHIVIVAQLLDAAAVIHDVRVRGTGIGLVRPVARVRARVAPVLLAPLRVGETIPFSENEQRLPSLVHAAVGGARRSLRRVVFTDLLPEMAEHGRQLPLAHDLLLHVGVFGGITSFRHFAAHGGVL